MDNATVIWNFLKKNGFNDYAVGAMMGNLNAESGLRPNNLEDSKVSKLGMGDATYTSAVNNGTYGNFVNDYCGYGLAQWTYPDRKQKLLNYVRKQGKPIDDLNAQLEYFLIELKTDFAPLYKKMLNATSLQQATSDFMLQFENPWDKSVTAQNNRYKNHALPIYNRFAGTTATGSTSNSRMMKIGDLGEDVSDLQSDLITIGYSCGPAGNDGEFGKATYAAVVAFQTDMGLTPDGVVGPLTKQAIEKALKNPPKNPSNPVVSTTVVQQAKTYNDVMMGYASKDENGRYSGGADGDQTGNEVKIGAWYNFSQNVILRPNDSALAETIAAQCEKACANNHIGYDQGGRNAIYSQAQKVGYDLSKITTNCDCDCSSLVSVCCICAGLPASNFYSGGNLRTTFNLKSACMNTGRFTALTDSKYLNQKNYLRRGDIILNESNHVTICLQNGAYAGETVASAPVSNNSKSGTVTASVLNVRSGPGTSYNIVGTLTKGTKVSIGEVSNGWGKISNGWISLTYVAEV